MTAFYETRLLVDTPTPFMLIGRRNNLEPGAPLSAITDKT
jgi:hypothetical protein